jgi:hypothetical protein
MDSKQSFSPYGPKRSLGTRSQTRLVLVLLALAFALAGGVRADDDDEGPRLPAIGRPEFFDEDGPIGAFQMPIVRVTPSEVQVEDPITVTIRVMAAGPVQRPPKQIRLEKFPGFAERFYVEYPDDPTFRRIDDRTWEFTCTFKPRGVNVNSVPSFPFVFFTPGLLPPERGYQVHRTASVAITVRPRAAVQPNDVARGVESQPIPESVYQIADGTSVLNYARPYSLSGWIFIAGICLLPPALGFLFRCIVWPRFSPNAKSRTSARRSHAAKSALAGLDRLAPGIEHSQAATAIVARYLRERFELTAEEPAPIEVHRHLESAGFDPVSSASAADFFRACDAIRYGHVPLTENPAELARQVILVLEAGPCPESASS